MMDQNNLKNGTMKKYSIIALLLLSGCNIDTPAKQYMRDVERFKVIKGVYSDDFYVITVDSCEYVVFSGRKQGGIVHKQNCRNHGK